MEPGSSKKISFLIFFLFLLSLLVFLFLSEFTAGRAETARAIPDEETKNKWLRAYEEAQKLRKNMKIPGEVYEDVIEELKDVSRKYGIEFKGILRTEKEAGHEGDKGKKETEEGTENSSGRYLLFVSSSVEPEVIRNHAKTLGGRVLFLIRGFVGVSPGEMVRVRPTLMWWMSIFGENFSKNKRDFPPFGIDPGAFERAGISSVPALLDPSTGCVVYGDVSAEKLIEAIKKRRCGEVLGRTWPIGEADGLLQIRAYLETVRLNWEDIKRRITEGLMKSLRDFECVDLPERPDTVTYRRRPLYELDFDIRNPETGEVLYPRGFRFNPLEYVHPAGSFLIVDGRSSLQVRALPGLLERGNLPSPVRILLTGGDAVAVGRLVGNRAPVFPSCSALKRLLSYGVCRHVPCLITFDPPYLGVKEFGTGDLERYLKEEEKEEEVEN